MLWSMAMESDNELDFLRPEVHGPIAWWGVTKESVGLQRAGRVPGRKLSPDGSLREQLSHQASQAPRKAGSLRSQGNDQLSLIRTKWHQRRKTPQLLPNTPPLGLYPKKIIR